MLDLLGGPSPLLDARAANALIEQRHDGAAIAAIESPLSRGRVVIGVTGTTLPPFTSFLGYAQSRARGGNLLALSGEDRAMFRVGPTFGRGELHPMTHLRWFFSTHWMLLVPLLLLGALLVAREGRRFTARRMRARLIPELP